MVPFASAVVSHGGDSKMESCERGRDSKCRVSTQFDLKSINLGLRMRQLGVSSCLAKQAVRKHFEGLFYRVVWPCQDMRGFAMTPQTLLSFKAC